MLREIASTETYTVLIVVCLLLVAVTKLLFSKRFQDLTGILFNFRYLKFYTRYYKVFDLFENLLFTNFIIGLTILGAISYNLSVNIDSSQYLDLSKLAFFIAIVLLTKTLIERVISRILNLGTFINSYFFVKASYKNFLGLLLIPINGLLIYTLDITQWVIIIFVTLLLLINCIGIFFFIKDNLVVIKNNFFYFILYLCALEISPNFILYKLIIKFGG